MLSKLEKDINEIWKIRESLSTKSNKKIVKTIENTIDLIDKGKARVAEKVKKNGKLMSGLKKQFYSLSALMSKKLYQTVQEMLFGGIKFHRNFLSGKRKILKKQTLE